MKASCYLLFILILLVFPAFLYGGEDRESIEGCLPLTFLDAQKFKVPKFEEFKVKKIYKGKPAKPVIKKKVKSFKTRIKELAKGGPNFAGHYTVMGWGCGTSCLAFAIEDATNGRIYLPGEISHVDSCNADCLPIEEGGTEYGILNYRLDSKLFVVVGAPNEDASKEGVTFYIWTGSKLKQIRFIPSNKKWCFGKDTAPDNTTNQDDTE